MTTTQPAASLWIDGRPVEGEGDTLPVLFPYDGSLIATLHEASTAQVAAAVAAAERAQPEWAALAPVERGRVLQRAAAIIR